MQNTRVPGPAAHGCVEEVTLRDSAASEHPQATVDRRGNEKGKEVRGQEFRAQPRLFGGP